MKVFVLILTLLSFSQLYGKERLWTIGVGLLDCGEFLEYQTYEVDRNALDSWIAGYISGLNRAMFDAGNQKRALTGEGRSLPAIRRTVVNYCSENPLSTLRAAVDDLYLNFRF
mgnify:CR=1 FL=1